MIDLIFGVKSKEAANALPLEQLEGGPTTIRGATSLPSAQTRTAPPKMTSYCAQDGRSVPTHAAV